jgi:hypothetical protein
MTQSQVHSFWQAFTPKLIIVWREGRLGQFWRSDALAGLTRCAARGGGPRSPDDYLMVATRPFVGNF